MKTQGPAPPSVYTSICPDFPPVNCEKFPPAKEFAKHVIAELYNFTSDQLKEIVSKVNGNLGEEVIQKLEVKCKNEVLRRNKSGPFTLQPMDYDDPHTKNQLLVEIASRYILKLPSCKLGPPQPEDGLDGFIRIMEMPLLPQEKISRARDIFTSLQVGHFTMKLFLSTSKVS